MGRQITYEIGALNIGRHVKVMMKDGGGRGGIPGVLKEATPSAALIKGDNNDMTKKHPWADVHDWTSRNATALVLPKPAANSFTAQPIVVAPAAPPAPLPDPFSFYATLGPNIAAALADVSAAEDLVDAALEQLQGAKSQHEDAVQRVNSLRAEAARVLGMIDTALIGTTAAKRNP